MVFFQEVEKKLVFGKNILVTCSVKLIYKSYVYLKKSEIPKFTEIEIFTKLQKMKKSSSVPGDLPPRVLKSFLLEISTPVSKLVNSCLKNGTFPKKFKIETTVVIEKVRPPQSLDDLRNLGLTRFFILLFRVTILLDFHDLNF